MTAGGLNPSEEGEPWNDEMDQCFNLMVNCSPERLIEFDRLMAEGGYEAVIEKVQQDARHPSRL